MRFPDRFDFVYEPHAQDLDLEDVMIPPLVLQPYVENAIWHGLMHKSEKGTINTSIETIGDMLKCSIEDDGIGRAAALRITRRDLRAITSQWEWALRRTG